MFDNVEALVEAAESLVSHGFYRAALSLVATEDVIRKKVGARVMRVDQVEDHANTPRIAYANKR